MSGAERLGCGACGPTRCRQFKCVYTDSDTNDPGVMLFCSACGCDADKHAVCPKWRTGQVHPAKILIAPHLIQRGSHPLVFSQMGSCDVVSRVKWICMTWRETFAWPHEQDASEQRRKVEEAARRREHEQRQRLGVQSVSAAVAAERRHLAALGLLPAPHADYSKAGPRPPPSAARRPKP